jgi:hypothetical protein
MKYTGEIEGQYGSREDKKKISSNTGDRGKYGRVGHPIWGPPSLPFNSFRGLTRQGRETDNSSPSNAEVKKSGAIPPLPHRSSWHNAQIINHGFYLL